MSCHTAEDGEIQMSVYLDDGDGFGTDENVFDALFQGALLGCFAFVAHDDVDQRVLHQRREDEQRAAGHERVNRLSTSSTLQPCYTTSIYICLRYVYASVCNNALLLVP